MKSNSSAQLSNLSQRVERRDITCRLSFSFVEVSIVRNTTGLEHNVVYDLLDCMRVQSVLSNLIIVLGVQITKYMMQGCILNSLVICDLRII